MWSFTFKKVKINLEKVLKESIWFDERREWEVEKTL